MIARCAPERLIKVIALFFFELSDFSRDRLLRGHRLPGPSDAIGRHVGRVTQRKQRKKGEGYGEQQCDAEEGHSARYWWTADARHMVRSAGPWGRKHRINATEIYGGIEGEGRNKARG
jgi:hypothetical protein